MGAMAVKNPELASGTWTETDSTGSQRIWEEKKLPPSLITYVRKVYQFTEKEEERDEIEKDIWKLENLDIAYKKNPIKNVQTLNFTTIIQDDLRKKQKRQFMNIYIMKRLQRSSKS